MSAWKCPNCKRVREKAEDIVCSQCPCGDYFKKINERDTNGTNS